MQLLMFYLMYLNMMFFNFMNNPMFLMLFLFSQVIIICFILILTSKLSWFSYILFLIFVGGILILFMYIISLISKDLFFFKNFFYKMLTIFSFFILIILMCNSELINLVNLKNEFMLEENSLMLNKLYSFPSNIINMFLINYLFLMLLMTMKITNFFFGPIRKKK